MTAIMRDHRKMNYYPFMVEVGERACLRNLENSGLQLGRKVYPPRGFSREKE